MSSPDAQQWQQAMNAEFDMLQRMGTWELVPVPRGRKIVSGKWVFALKRGADGEVVKYKARFVARGFTQEQGVDYNETYAPVAQRSTLRMLLAVAAARRLQVEHSDVSNAFLNSVLAEGGDVEEIFVSQPEGCEQFGPDGQELVCRLKKGLYGLKQAARLWFQEGEATCDGFHALYRGPMSVHQAFPKGNNLHRPVRR